MPSLRIPFPEKDTPSLISLHGNRITIGRLPDNTIQIADRTISAHHAELISENGHYRVHDLGATNGTQVNGQVVSDFHLSENCKITFGSVECEFTTDTPQSEAVDAEKALITRADADALKQENSTLRAQIDALRKENEAVKQSHAAQEGEATVSQAEFDRLTGELSAMALKVVETERLLEELRTELGVLRRDRGNLQRALDEARQNVAAEAAPSEAATAPSAKPTLPEPPQVPDALLPVPPDSPTEATAPTEEPAAAEEPAAPSPAQTMAPPQPKPLFVPGVGAPPAAAPTSPARPMPTAQPPRAPGQLQPAASAKPGLSGSGMRPAAFANTPGAQASPKPGTPIAKPGAPQAKPGLPTYSKPGAAAKAGIPVKPPMAAVPKAVPAGARPVATPAGPKGTQKLS